MSKMSYPFRSCFLLIFIISRLMSIIGKLKPWTNLLPSELLSLDISTRLHFDSDTAESASSDFGKLVRATPAAVLRPTSIEDIISLVKFSYTLSAPFGIAARGRGHSVQGQALAENGVVIDMRSLMNNDNNDNGSNSSSSNSRIRVCESKRYVDVGGEQLWIDVLGATLEHGVAPVSWTDYLYLSIGGTLSNAGISGQTFRYGPQISNVHELDVVTGKGELVKCSEHVNSELFYGVLGGLGQFGIISRARIGLQPAPKRVKWVRMLYDDFPTFTGDQERLISIHGDMKGIFNGLNYVEGSLIMQQTPPNNWRSSFFSPSDQSKITSLVTPNGIIYCLEVVKYYDNSNMDTIDQELQEMLEGLSFLSGFIFIRDVTYIDFLNRVRKGELKLESKGLWHVPHPWLNLYIPRSQILEFNSEIFTKVLTQGTLATGPYLIYPMLRNKWDDRMFAVIPEEDVFYTIGLLHSNGFDGSKVLEDQNREILRLCEEKGIKVKQYLPHYVTKEEWNNHFGSKWEKFLERKAMFDPKMILSPGQRIFN
ncbi:Cytokinin dehydrogenase [Ancistrocladus abbreviatus]